MSVLERFAEKGWLDFGDSKYSAQDRLKAAEKLQKDYEQSYFYVDVCRRDSRENRQ